MKKNDWILTTAVAIYSYLFYQQNLGINFLIFSIALIVLLFFRNKDVYKNAHWLMAACGTLLSAFCVAYYGNGLSVITNIISLAILSAFSINPKTSLITSLFFSVYSISASYVFVILDAIKRAQNRVIKTGNKSSSTKFLLYIVSFFIVLIFFFMYKASNPLFDNFTKKINLDFISFNWILFTIGGFFLLYGFLYHKKIKAISDADESPSNSLFPDLDENKKTFLNLKIETEKLSGFILLLMLNILLLTVNMLDANYLFFDGSLPKDLSYSAFVHQGTGALIFSIIIAILIILFYFRGELNFYKDNRALKLLAYLWVIQNVFMIISTAYRNNLYINEYSLTYKRIGVYVWLLLAIIGLITTFIKVLKVKSNWFLFRNNAWLFYAVLVFSCLVNWDVIVTEFNINKAEQKHKPLDKFYLITLSEKNIPKLLSLNDSIKSEIESDEYNSSSSLSYRYNYAPVDCKPVLHNKLYHFLDEMQFQEWQSFCFERKRVYDEIMKMNQSITEIQLPNYYLQSLKPLQPLTNLHVINFSGNNIQDLGELKMFPTLENLNLSNNRIDSVDFFPKMEDLKTLVLTNNNIKKLYALTNVANISSIDISDNKLIDFKTLPSFKKLKSLTANNIYINDYSPLLRLPQLRELSLLGSITTNKEKLPSLPLLERLSIQTNFIGINDSALFENLKGYINLTYLNISSNQLDNFYSLTSYYDTKKTVFERNKFSPLLPSLKALDISHNNIKTLYPLVAYPDLEELYVNGNHLSVIIPIEQLTKLKTLEMDDCGLKNINFLSKLKAIEVLSIGNNGITDYSILVQLKELKQLNIGTVSKTQLDQLKKMLPKVNITTTVIN